ncbi:hypothetical protein niasHT_000524 [Heterodera trifolii]|uniref:SAP domain-containing protein n=1 Tax=Heterodera trifolii TaxID=157864 RepID=A0ABD2LTY0_9BILA
MTNRAEYLFRFFESMPEKELREELRKASLYQGGTRKQMLKRLRDHHRKELIEHRKKNHRNFLTENLYDYLIVIDFECTCEAGKYEYDNEIIEFPAVLVSVKGRKIIDTFHAVIRPKTNPKLTEYCTKLTGITQQMVDEACTFPEVLDMFRDWMAKHGLDGLHRVGGSCRRFCYITDGPWDIGKFLQSDCLRWAMPLPHDFRSFVNLRRAFVNFYCHARPGQPKPARLPSAELSEMLKRLDMQFVGREHCGMDDTINIARIVIQMLNDHAELRVNEKLVNGALLLPWHQKQLIFTDQMWEKRQKNGTTTNNNNNQSKAAPSPPLAALEASHAATMSFLDSFGSSTSASSSAEDIICAGMARMGFRDVDDDGYEEDAENGRGGISPGTTTMNGGGNKLATATTTAKRFQNGITTTNTNGKKGGDDDDDGHEEEEANDGDTTTTHGNAGLYKWWDALPYKLVRITREQFIGELFLECESCDEETEQAQEQAKYNDVWD